MIRYLAQGGLGNQLFVLAEAFNAQKFSEEKIVVSVPRKRIDSILDLNLSSPIKIRVAPLDDIAYQFVSNLSHKIPNSNLSKFLTKKVSIATQVDSRFDIGDLKQAKISVGFFQDYRTVEDSWEQMKPILETKFLTLLPKILRVTGVRDFSMIHIRRGDYEKNRGTYGILSLEYYTRIIPKLEYPIVISTDDQKYILKLQHQFPNALVVGPNQLSAWESLALMAAAQEVVAANSTLSWWAAYYVVKSGRTSYLPEPWFKRIDSQGPNLFFPGVLKNESQFE